MPADLEFTGERFVPGIPGEIVYEHAHRYAFARGLVAGKRVLDAACGEGYGSALLAGAAAKVIGVDIDAATVAHAVAAYADRANLEFRAGSVTALPVPDASVDVVVSFETIEHLEAADQPRMLAEFARVLAPQGVLVLSAPNRVEYSEARGVVNPFHRHEHDRDELAALLAADFPAQRWYRQRVWLGSLLWSEEGGAQYQALTGDAQSAVPATPPAPMYFVVIAARSPAALPPAGAGLSLFSDTAESELKRNESHAAECLRLDALLKERDAALARQTGHVLHLEGLVTEREAAAIKPAGHIAHLEALLVEHRERLAERDAQLADRGTHVRHLEDLVAFRDRIVVERDAQLAARAADIGSLQRALEDGKRNADEARHESQRLERAAAAQERIIAYRQTFRWWLTLPWMRLRLAWWRLLGGVSGE